MFLANDCARQTLWPSSTKWRRAKASWSMLPDAKPWYAMSKKEKWPASLTALEISLHCCCEGSTPVGLCAQAWNRKMLPLGASLMSFIMPSKSRPMVSLL